MNRRWAIIGAALAMALVLSGCSSSTPDPVKSPPTPKSTPASADADTIRSLVESPAESPDVEIADPVRGFGGAPSFPATYTSGGLNVSGLIRYPDGDGPFPAVVVVHGGVDPDQYESGGDLVPLQRALVESGYAVFAVDLRGYGDSDASKNHDAWTIDPGFGWSVTLDWGMALDVVNALRILRSGDIESVDPDRVGLVGHSMGGLLALDAAVIAPEATDVVVTLSAVSSQIWDAIEHGLDPDSSEFAAIVEQHGTPDDNATYWDDISPRTFADRMTAPLLLVHGGADKAALPRWSEDTARAWKDAGATARAVIVPGANHALQPHQDVAFGYVLEALDAQLKD